MPFYDTATAPFTFIDYRVRVTNNGPSFATNVRMTETMTPPAGKRVRFVCDTTALVRPPATRRAVLGGQRDLGPGYGDPDLHLLGACG